ncbi:putative RfeF [Phyllosticta citricarpa]
MGLASKLAAAGPPAGGAGGAGGAYPGAPAYQAYPGASGGPPSGYPPQGAPPGQGYGAPPPGGPPPGQQASPAQLQAFKQMLGSAIQENQLQNFYPPNSPALEQIAQRASVQVAQLCQRWRLPQEIGNDIVKLGLFDIILYIDDSGSMQFEENGERIKDLKLILERVAFAATLFDDDGISVRFMNSLPPPQVTEHIRTEQQVEQLMSQIQFKGLTPMGSHLKERVIDEVLRNARAGQLRKPVLVITITDGQPAGEPQNAVFETIKNATSEVSRMPQYGPGAIKFQFAQVGNDEKAREFLSKLDQDPMVGHLVDCTSNYENESAEMARANPPVDLTPELWLVKLLLGAIDKSYDRQDEKGNAAPPPGGPGGYGAPPGQYGAPQGGYGAPPPGQYGQPPQGYNPQGGYGGAPPPGQYGAPPPGGQYGRPPPGQPGYPPQQGGYPPRY